MDVVHVLNKVHRSLRAGGVLLDTHPEPELPSIEVRLASGRTVPIGKLGEEVVARARMLLDGPQGVIVVREASCALRLRSSLVASN
jgi:hypothetical protein